MNYDSITNFVILFIINYNHANIFTINDLLSCIQIYIIYTKKCFASDLYKILIYWTNNQFQFKKKSIAIFIII
jgi:hypothetical protein